MKRVNVRTGLQQRMNEILGDDYGSASADPRTGENIYDITPWSIQAAMLSNMRRISAAVCGDTMAGRPMRGLSLTSPGGTTSFSISAGYGFTRTGEIVVLENAVNQNISNTTANPQHVYLLHKMGVIDGIANPDGRSTALIGESARQNIVYDDLAASAKGSVQAIVDDIVLVSTSLSGADDRVYLGSISVMGGVITAVTETRSRGIDQYSVGIVTLQSLVVSGSSQFNGAQSFSGTSSFSNDVTFNASKKIYVGSDYGATQSITLTTPTGTATFGIKNGIITSVVPA